MVTSGPVTPPKTVTTSLMLIFFMHLSTRLPIRVGGTEREREKINNFMRQKKDRGTYRLYNTMQLQLLYYANS